MLGSFRCTPEQICQAVLTGTGTVKGYGVAREVVAVNQDRSVTPCGPESAADQSIRRILIDKGTLVLRLSGERCVTPAGTFLTSIYRIDGRSSTGAFAGARGRGLDVLQRKNRPGHDQGEPEDQMSHLRVTIALAGARRCTSSSTSSPAAAA